MSSIVRRRSARDPHGGGKSLFIGNIGKDALTANAETIGCGEISIEHAYIPLR